MATIIGDNSDNTLTDTDGDDVVAGLGGDDTIYGSNGGADTLKGGAGDDEITKTYTAGDYSADLLLGGDGADRLGNSSLGVDTLDGGAGDDYMYGFARNDFIGGAGFDSISIDGRTDAVVTADLRPLNSGGVAELSNGASLSGIEAGEFVMGGEASTVFLPDFTMTLAAGSGADSIYGGSARDVIYTYYDGRTGDDGRADVVEAGAGDDYVAGGQTDLLDGGEGTDEFLLKMYGSDGVAVNLNDFVGDVIELDDGTVISGFERGTIAFNDADNLIRIGQGRGFTVSGGRGADTINGSTAADTIDGGAQADSLIGAKGADSLIGGGGDDVIDGGAGDDVLIGGKSADTLTGGAGADAFVYGDKDLTSGRDLITDLENGDVIDLSRIDADKGVDGNQAFVLVDGLSGAAGEVSVGFDGTETQVRLDLDGGGVDYVIRIAGDHTDFDNFIL